MTDNLGYLFAAYALVWIGIALYVHRLSRRTDDLVDEIGALRDRLER